MGKKSQNSNVSNKIEDLRRAIKNATTAEANKLRVRLAELEAKSGLKARKVD